MINIDKLKYIKDTIESMNKGYQIEIRDINLSDY